jgi:anti-anti-sigma factor
MSREPPALSVRTSHTEDTSTVTLTGEIDLYNSTRVNWEFQDVLARTPPPQRVRVDLSGVTFMDTSGLAVLLTAHKRALALGCLVKVSSTSPVIARLLEMSGLTGMLVEDAD